MGTAAGAAAGVTAGVAVGVADGAALGVALGVAVGGFTLVDAPAEVQPTSFVLALAAPFPAAVAHADAPPPDQNSHTWISHTHIFYVTKDAESHAHLGIGNLILAANKYSDRPCNFLPRTPCSQHLMSAIYIHIASRTGLHACQFWGCLAAKAHVQR